LILLVYSLKNIHWLVMECYPSRDIGAINQIV
jgi:hypothetical protein